MPAKNFFQRCFTKALCWIVLSASLTACKTIPEAVSSMPFFASMSQKESGLLEPLPAPVPRTWPDAQQDIINQRARGFGLVNAPEAKKYLNGLYGRIKTAAGVPNWPGEVQISAQSSLQAYATAAGNLYITLPWLTSVQSEDELVALLAHEFAHVYLHYHKLEGAIETADTAAGFLSIAVKYASKTAQVTGWTKVDSLVASYSIGKALATALYGQTEERAADRVSLHLTHKMGYSYDHGPKAFLERLAGWEDYNDALLLKQQDAFNKAIRESAQVGSANLNAKANNEVSKALNSGAAEVTAEITVAGTQFFFNLRKALGKFTNTHPDTIKRQDTLAQLADATPELQADKAPVTAPLKVMLSGRQTAQILKNYELAYQALAAPESAAAVGWAQQARSGPTATHLVPLFALYSVANTQGGASIRGLPRDLTQLFEVNINSEGDRAWFSYRERTTGLNKRGQRAEATRVLERGMVHFAQAEEVLPDVVTFYGETEGWAKAKERAQDCSRRFPKIASRCNGAARSPAEVAALEKEEEKKAEQLVNKLKKR